MALTINTNLSSLTTQRLLRDSNLGLTTAFERLSSGLRINRAADDAAGLVISSSLSSQIDGLSQATRNANDAISMAQVTEGALAEIVNNLQRIRELTIQAGSGINSSEQLAALQQEFEQGVNLINSVADNTTFGSLKLLDGSTGVKSFLVGANSGQHIEIKLERRFNADVTGLGLQGLRYDTDDIATMLGVIDNAIKVTDEQRAELGAIQNAMGSTIRNLNNVTENVAASRSRIRDADFAKETTALTKNEILQQSSISVLAQANQRPQVALQILR